jgi:hypothetical protein
VFCVRLIAGKRKVTFLNMGLSGGKLSVTFGRKPLRYSFKSYLLGTQHKPENVYSAN